MQNCSINTSRVQTFFLDPLNESHSNLTKISGLITSIALTILTLGGYLLLLRLWNPIERSAKEQSTLKSSLEELKEKQISHLQKLKSFAANGKWEHLQTHTSHPDSGFDWWMFPVTRPSRGYGKTYTVNREEAKVLMKDQEFKESYREGVILVAKSWGWDLVNREDLTNNKQKWTGYQVRLGKMLGSLKLFEQKDLHEALVYFIDKYGLRNSLERWICRLL